MDCFSLGHARGLVFCGMVVDAVPLFAVFSRLAILPFAPSSSESKKNSSIGLWMMAVLLVVGATAKSDVVVIAAAMLLGEGATVAPPSGVQPRSITLTPLLSALPLPQLVLL